MFEDDDMQQHRDPATAGRPEGLPEKFWDPVNGQIRIDALTKSYLELERQYSSAARVPGANASPDDIAAFRRAVGVPEDPDKYDIALKTDRLTPDADVNRILHEAGFSQAQAQLVYDLASDRMIPMIEQMAAETEARRHAYRLAEHFGGEQRWQEAARQITSWGRSHMPAEVVEALAGSYEGVVALERMMRSDEPVLGRGGSQGDDMLSAVELKSMMNDKRYWKQKDPAWIARVEAGFKRLYPGQQ